MDPHGIPISIILGLKTKLNQNKPQLCMLFSEFLTSLIPNVIKNLPGIKKINSPTLIFRADKYEGNLTESV